MDPRLEFFSGANRDLIELNNDVSRLNAGQIRGVILRNRYPDTMEFRARNLDAFLIIYTQPSLTRRPAAKCVAELIKISFGNSR